jgi:DNA-damage-inducible protein J
MMYFICNTIGAIMKTSVINARITPELKKDVEQILGQLGITTTQAITMYFEQIKQRRGIPFELKLPNDETLAAMEDARENRDLNPVSADQLKDQLTK